MQSARAEKMRAAKKARLEEADRDTQNEDMGEEGHSVPRAAGESSLAIPSTSSAVDEPEDGSSHSDHDDGVHRSSSDDRYIHDDLCIYIYIYIYIYI